ncbi:DJ-1/PfpI family protein [Nocardia gipuzkoensis]
MSQTIGNPVEDNRAAIRPDVETNGRVAILTADKVEDTEFFYPYYRFAEEGYEVDVLTPPVKGSPATRAWH